MLSRRGMPLREFFEYRLPNCKPMQDAWKLGGAPQILPSEPVVWSLVGAALDYRVRYLFAVTSPERFVAAHVAYDTESELHASYANLATSLIGLLARNDPRGAPMATEVEADLARYCYVLAMYESLFRGAADSSLYTLRIGASADEQLALAPSAAVVDLVALTGAAATTLSPLFKKTAILNPSFSGSPDVLGADADLIVDHCLIDIKTTISKSLDRQTLYQLVGYLLLDYGDEYAINALGFYLSRIPALVVWPAKDLIASMSNGVESVKGLRKDLKALLALDIF